MPVFGGFEAQVQVSFDGGTVYANIPKVTDCNLDLEANEIDASNHDTAGWEEKLNGLKKWGVSGEYLMIDVADTVQDALENAFLTNQTIKIKFRPKVGSGLKQYQGDCVVGKLSHSGPTGDAYKVSLELRSRGTLTRTAQ